MRWIALALLVFAVLAPSAAARPEVPGPSCDLVSVTTSLSPPSVWVAVHDECLPLGDGDGS